MGEQAAEKHAEHGSSAHGFGAELTTRQFFVLIVAIALGTLLECESCMPVSQHQQHQQQRQQHKLGAALRHILQDNQLESVTLLYRQLAHACSGHNACEAKQAFFTGSTAPEGGDRRHVQARHGNVPGIAN
jgi:hypothetical protein